MYLMPQNTSGSQIAGSALFIGAIILAVVFAILGTTSL